MSFHSTRQCEWRAALMLVAVAAACATLAGCKTDPRAVERVKAKYSVRNKKVIVAPFSDPAMTTFDSKIGTELAQSIGYIIWLNNPKGLIATTSQLPRELQERDYSRMPMQQAMQDINESLRKLGWKQRPDTVIEGEILELHTREPNSPNIMRGRITAVFHLRDIARWEPPLYSGRVTCIYPEDPYEMVLSQDMTDKQMKEALLTLCGQRIGEHFIDHEKMPDWAP